MDRHFIVALSLVWISSNAKLLGYIVVPSGQGVRAPIGFCTGWSVVPHLLSWENPGHSKKPCTEGSLPESGILFPGHLQPNGFYQEWREPPSNEITDTEIISCYLILVTTLYKLFWIFLKLRETGTRVIDHTMIVNRLNIWGNHCFNPVIFFPVPSHLLSLHIDTISWWWGTVEISLVWELNTSGFESFLCLLQVLSTWANFTICVSFTFLMG